MSVMAVLLIVSAVGLWWVGTGLVLRNVHRPEPDDDSQSGRGPDWLRVAPLAALTAGVPASLAGLVLLRSATPGLATALTTYILVFVLWGWLELTFYCGWITGPLKTPWQGGRDRGRVLHAFWASAYHELALVLMGLAVLGLSGGGSRWAPWFYLGMAAMHTSARLNVVLGVRNLNAHFLPDRLSYLASLFTRRRMNGLMPFSLVVGTAATVMVVRAALNQGAGESTAGLTLLACTLALGVLEHLLLIVPLPVHRLFEWGLPAGKRSSALGTRVEAGLS